MTTQLDSTPVPLTGVTTDPDEAELAVLSMRILEFAIAVSALATAILLGFNR